MEYFKAAYRLHLKDQTQLLLLLNELLKYRFPQNFFKMPLIGGGIFFGLVYPA